MPIARTSRLLFLFTLFLLLFGCDRGSQPELIGKPAPDFTLNDIDSPPRKLSLHDYRGKIVLLNFWASWCAPCIQEAPSLVEMQKKLAPHVLVVAISTDEDAAGYQRFAREKIPGILTIRDPLKKTSDLYGTVGWPETYVIDTTGVVRRKFIGPIQWDSTDITEYLKQL